MKIKIGSSYIQNFNSKWEDNIRMDLKELGVNTRNCVDSVQNRDYCRALVNAALNLWKSVSHGVSCLVVSTTYLELHIILVFHGYFLILCSSCSLFGP